MMDDDLKDYCRQFVQRMQIGCPETIYQTDRVIENACEFIEGICERVGYVEADD